MKKVLALALALVLALSLSAVAFATTTGPVGESVPPVENNASNIQIDLGKGSDDTVDPTINPDKPGATYKFALLVAGEDEVYADDEYVKHLTVSIKESGDKMIKSYAIVKEKGDWYVKVTTNGFFNPEEKTANWT